MGSKSRIASLTSEARGVGGSHPHAFFLLPFHPFLPTRSILSLPSVPIPVPTSPINGTARPSRRSRGWPRWRRGGTLSQGVRGQGVNRRNAAAFFISGETTARPSRSRGWPGWPRQRRWRRGATLPQGVRGRGVNRRNAPAFFISGETTARPTLLGN